jgi:methionine biosynthesis protein MetW
MARCWTTCSNTRGCTGYGVEIDDTNVLACVRRGVNVLQLNLDEGLTVFADQSFDVVLQIDTLQHLRNAEVMLRETARVGRAGIVAFPNFAHWPNRSEHAARAHARDRRLPYQWYDTPNIRVGTSRTLRCWRTRTNCASSTPLVCRTAKWCAGCRTRGRGRRCFISSVLPERGHPVGAQRSTIPSRFPLESLPVAQVNGNHAGFTPRKILSPDAAQ